MNLRMGIDLNLHLHNYMKKILSSALAILSLTTTIANASVVTYANEPAWVQNVSNVKTIDFNNYNTIQYVGSSVTDTGITFSGTNAALFYQGNNTFAGSQWAGKKWFSFEQGSNSTYQITFANAISALSFDFADYYSANMSLSLVLSNGDQLTASQGGSNRMGNVSFTSSTLFNRVTLISSGTQGPFFGIDNMDFGIANAVNAVPEPGSLALMGLAFVGLGLARRKGSRA
jgi:hypothetical protein